MDPVILACVQQPACLLKWTNEIIAMIAITTEGTTDMVQITLACIPLSACLLKLTEKKGSNSQNNRGHH